MLVMARKIRYKDVSSSLERMSKPQEEAKNRASVGMDSFVGEFYYIRLEKLIPYKNQARAHFNEEELEQLAKTIKEHGIRQPLTIVKSQIQEGLFEVISGERRLRAAKIVGLEKVPCIILPQDAAAEEIALVENIQRQDLHPLELSIALKKLVDQHGWGGQTELQKRLGISQSFISSCLKMLELSEEVRKYAIEKNYSGRDKLLDLLKLPDDEARKALIDNQKKKRLPGVRVGQSILRISYTPNGLNIQKKPFQNLSPEQRIKVKESLLNLVLDLDEFENQE